MSVGYPATPCTENVAEAGRLIGLRNIAARASLLPRKAGLRFLRPMTAIRRRPTALADPMVSIVIPVYNEKNTVEEILRRVLETPIRRQVVVVDDCSTDGTRQILETMREQQAKGAA